MMEERKEEGVGNYLDLLFSSVIFTARRYV